MKKSIFGIALVFMFAGCGKYIQPNLNGNTSVLVLKDTKNSKYATYIQAKIDNQTIDTYKSSITNVRVNAGKHTITLDSSIYYGSRVKRREVVNFILDFKSQKVYTIDLVPKTFKLMNDNNITGTYRIFENKKLILKKDFIFRDRILNSTISNGETSSDVVAIAVIQSVVLGL